MKRDFICKEEIAKTLEPLRNEMLVGYKKINEFCEQRGIRLIAHAGTLLGGVREGGFVKWDDDMDFLVPFQDMKPHLSDFINFIKGLGYDLRENFGYDAAGCNIFLDEVDLEYKDYDGEIIEFKHRPTIDLFFISPFPVDDSNVKEIHKLHCYEAIFNETYIKEAPGWIWSIKNDFMKNVEDRSCYVKNIEFDESEIQNKDSIDSRFKEILNFGSELDKNERDEMPHFFVHPEIYKLISIVPNKLIKIPFEDTYVWGNGDYEKELDQTYLCGKNGSSWKEIKYWSPYHIWKLAEKLKKKTMAKKTITAIVTIYNTSDENLNNLNRIADELNGKLKMLLVCNDFELERVKNFVKSNNIELNSAPDIMKKNGKLSFVANKVDTELVFIMDPDDDIHIDKFNEFLIGVSNFEFTNEPLVYINKFGWWSERWKKITHISGHNNEQKLLSESDFINSDHPMHNASLIYNSDLFKKHIKILSEEYDEIMAQDVYLASNFSNLVGEDKVAFLDLPFYIYKKYDLTNSNTYSKLNFFNEGNFYDNIKLFDKLNKLNLNNRLSVIANQMIIRDILNISRKIDLPLEVIKEFLSRDRINDFIEVNGNEILIKSNYCKINTVFDFKNILKPDITLLLTFYNYIDYEYKYWLSVYKKIKDKIKVQFIIDRPEIADRFSDVDEEDLFINNENIGKLNSIYKHVKDGNVKTMYFKSADPDDFISIDNLLNIDLRGEESIIKMNAVTFNDDEKETITQDYVDAIFDEENGKEFESLGTGWTIIPTRGIHKDSLYQQTHRINLAEDQLLGAISYANGFNIRYIDYSFYLYRLSYGISSSDNFSDPNYHAEMLVSIAEWFKLFRNSKAILNKLDWPLNMINKYIDRIDSLEKKAKDGLSIYLEKYIFLKSNLDNFIEEDRINLTLLIPFHKQNNDCIEYLKNISENFKNVQIVIGVNHFEKERLLNLDKFENVSVIVCDDNKKKHGKLSKMIDYVENDYVQVVDPDDKIDLEQLKKFNNKNLLNNSHYKMFINTSFLYSESEDRITEIVGEENELGEFSIGKIKSDHPLMNSNIIYESSKFKSVINIISMEYDGIMAQDVVLANAFMHHVEDEEILIENIPFYYYIRYDKSMTSVYSINNIFTFENMMENFYAIRVVWKYWKSQLYNFARKILLHDAIRISIEIGAYWISKEIVLNNPTFISLIDKVDQPIHDKIIISDLENTGFIREIDLSNKTKDDFSIKRNSMSVVLTLYQETLDEVIEMLESNWKKILNFGLELIVVFDRFVDATIISKLQLRYHNVIFIHNGGNFGKTKSVYKASKVASNNWIKCVDPDDEFKLSKNTLVNFEKFISENEIDKNDISIITHDFNFIKIDEHGIQVYDIFVELQKNEGVFDRDYISNIMDKKFLPFNANKIYSSKSIAINIPEEELVTVTMHEDVYITSAISKDDRLIAHYKENLYNYYFGIGMTASEPSPKLIEQVEKVYLSFKDKIDEYPAIYQNELIQHNLIHSLVRSEDFTPKEAELFVEKIIKKKKLDEKTTSYLTKRIIY